MKMYRLLLGLGLLGMVACDTTNPPDEPMPGGDGNGDPGYPYLFSVTLESNVDPNTRAFYLAYNPFSHRLLGWAEAVIGEEVTVDVPEDYSQSTIDLVSIWVIDDGQGTFPRVFVKDQRMVERQAWIFGTTTVEQEYEPEETPRTLVVTDAGATLDPSFATPFASTRANLRFATEDEQAPYQFSLAPLSTSLLGQTERLLLNQYNALTGQYIYNWLLLPGDNAAVDTVAIFEDGWRTPEVLTVSVPDPTSSPTMDLFGYRAGDDQWLTGFRVLSTFASNGEFKVPDLDQEFAAFRYQTRWTSPFGVFDKTTLQSQYTNQQSTILPFRESNVAILDSTFDRFSFNITGDDVIAGRATYATTQKDTEGNVVTVYSWVIEAPPGRFEAFSYALPGAITQLSGYFNREPLFANASSIAYPGFIDYTSFLNELQTNPNSLDFATYEISYLGIIGRQGGENQE